VLVLEARRTLGHKVCGEFISWEAQETLGSLGLLAPVQAADPVPLESAVITSRSGLAADFHLSLGSWGLSRRALDTALADAAQAAGATLSLGSRVVRYESLNGSYVIAGRSDGREFTLESRAVIVASGRSGSADLPPRSPSPPTSLIGIKRHYASVRMPPQVELYLFRGGYVGLAPVEDGVVNLCLLANRSALDAADKRPDRLIDRLLDRIPALARHLDGAEPLDDAPLAAAPVDLWRRPNPWDHVACVGDAAGMIPPLAGDGIAAALRSAELCAPLAHAYLAGDLTLEQWEQSYRRSWHATFDAPLALARRLETWLDNRLGSELLLGLGRLLPPIARRLANLTRGRAAPPFASEYLSSAPSGRGS
jgi:flavin-dependent dehydrogenase